MREASYRSPMIQKLTIRRPDDWHVHLRDGDMLSDVVNYTARQFSRAIIMPNLTPPVTTVTAGKAYRQRILDAVDPSLNFTPLMVCYLTDTIDPAEVERGFTEGVFAACSRSRRICYGRWPECRRDDYSASPRI